MQIISAGELSSMDQCWSVFAAAAASPITGWLVMLASDELNLTMTMKAEFKHNGQTSDTVQRDYWHNSHKTKHADISACQCGVRNIYFTNGIQYCAKVLSYPSFLYILIGNVCSVFRIISILKK